jgi:hypothetical protein
MNELVADPQDRSIAVQTMTSLTGVNVIQVRCAMH